MTAMSGHAWFEAQFSFATWIECECGFRPQSQEDMDGHIRAADRSES
jgi:hypothetical protein